jgi:hypothetical protein
MQAIIPIVFATIVHPLDAELTADRLPVDYARGDQHRGNRVPSLLCGVAVLYALVGVKIIELKQGRQPANHTKAKRQ